MHTISFHETAGAISSTPLDSTITYKWVLDYVEGTMQGSFTRHLM